MCIRDSDSSATPLARDATRPRSDSPALRLARASIRPRSPYPRHSGLTILPRASRRGRVAPRTGRAEDESRRGRVASRA
eukprot:2424169-Lingulodinium_polyedra.AAC.1